MATLEEIIRMDNISMKYHSLNGEITALEGINFTVTKGEFISIVGPSGCGKSTLLSLIAGLYQPSSGRIMIDGEPVELPAR
jgi:NitT/TauT family transport system ATP-binding protein